MHIRKKALLAIVISIVCTILASCHVAPSSVEPVASESEISIGNAERFVFYSYRSSEGTRTEYDTGFEMNDIYVPFEVKTSARLNSGELGKMITSDDYYDFYCDFQFSLELSEAVATVDLKPAEIGWPNEEYYREGILMRSLWATLTQNETGIDSVRLFRNGQAYSKIYGYPNEPVIELDENGAIVATPVHLPAYAQDDLDSIRALVPYSGMVSYSHDDIDIPGRSISDGLILHAEVYLERLFGANHFPNSFAKIEDADSRWLLSVALLNTKLVQWAGEEQSGSASVSHQLLPLMQTARSESGFLKEHVETTAQLLFGNEVNVHHERVPGFGFDKYSGVYIMPTPMGLERITVPIVVDYKALSENQYELDVVFVTQTSDGYWFENDVPVSGDQLFRHCLESNRRHTIGVYRLDDGSFICQSYKSPE